MHRWLREPAIHFILIGAALFAVHGAVAAPVDDPRTIRVDAAVVRALSAELRLRGGQEPSADELRSRIDRHLEEELLVREAIALGLDQDDPIVRRRLAEKMRRLLEAEGVGEPEPGELERFLGAHAERYEQPAAISFEHVLLSDPATPERVAVLLADLRAGRIGLPAGDPSSDGGRVTARTDRAVAAGFGEPMARELGRLPLDRWEGPLRSPRGLHLVRVTGRTAVRRPSLDQVRDRVLADWRDARRLEVVATAIDRLRAGYVIDVELPDEQPTVVARGER
jgi:hypothetical protein